VTNASFSSSVLTSASASVLHGGFDLCLLCPPGSLCSGGSGVTQRENFWRGQDMLCNQESCNAISGACNPLKCFNLSSNGTGSRREGCAGGCRASAMVYRCPPGVCMQGNGSAAGNICRNGHAGPTCATCLPGWAIETGRCRVCSATGASSYLLLAVLLIVVLIFLYLYSWRPVFRDMESSEGMKCITQAMLDAWGWASEKLGLAEGLKQILVR
jgi:hypothetical protein